MGSLTAPFEDDIKDRVDKDVPDTDPGPSHYTAVKTPAPGKAFIKGSIQNPVSYQRI